MLKVTMTTPGGKKILVIGLSFANLDKLRADAGNGYIAIDPAPLGMSHEVLIFAGATEQDLAEMIHKSGAEFTAETIVDISDKQKH